MSRKLLRAHGGALGQPAGYASAALRRGSCSTVDREHRPISPETSPRRDVAGPASLPLTPGFVPDFATLSRRHGRDRLS
jgi:hypothetical protein